MSRKYKPSPLPDDLLVAPGRMLTSMQAAAYSGLALYRIGSMARAGMLPYMSKGQAKYFRISDLDAYLDAHIHAGTRKFYFANDERLPRELVARILGLSITSLRFKHATGGRLLEDLTPEAVRKAIERQCRARLEREISRDARAKVRRTLNLRILNLHKVLSTYRRFMKNERCSHCGHPLLRKYSENRARKTQG